MLKFFRLPFATTGDKTAVPDPVDTNGNVSYSQGYGFDYQRQKTDPAAKNIERDKMNQIFFDVTTAVAELQSQGVPDFITTALNGGAAYSYAINALVRWTDGDLYISLAAANTADPTDTTKWAKLPTPARIQAAFNTAVVAAGTADALTGAFSPAIAALPAAPGTLTAIVRAGSANATATPTFKADGTTAKTIVKGNNLPLVAGDIAGAGHWLDLQYDATLDKWVLQNPATGVTHTGYMLLADEKAQNTQGGSSVAGDQTRVLNTVRANTISGASLASNQVTLPAGTYRVRGSAASIDSSNHRAHLYNVTDSVDQVLGTSEAGSNSGTADSISTRSFIDGHFIITASKVFELRHYTVSAVATFGLGAAVNAGGNEVYSMLEIIKDF